MQAHRGAGTGPAVLEGVGQGLLHQPVHRELHSGRQVRRLPADLQRGIQSRGPDPVDERVELAEIRYRLPGLAGVLAGGLAQDAEEPAGIGQRGPPGGRHGAHDVGGPVRRGRRRGDRRVGQGGHDGEVVGDDVVHLAGDPGAFGGCGKRGLLVLLALQPFRAVVQFGEVGAAGGDVQAKPEGGGDHAGHEDRVKPPAAACEHEQPGQRGELEHSGARQRVPPRPPRCHGVQGGEQGRAVDRAGIP